MNNTADRATIYHKANLTEQGLLSFSEYVDN